MEYLSFRIQNFKGIKDTTIELNRLLNASIFPLVGLNESGKTTILEAIHSFNPDKVTGNLLQLSSSQNDIEQFKKRVPRDKLATFTGEISITAIVSLNEVDKSIILSKIAELDFITDIDSLPDTLTIKRFQTFENGDYKRYLRWINLPTFKVKSNKKAKKFHESDDNQIRLVHNIILSLLPHIAYFPTFIFNFPDTIYLQQEQGALSKIEHRTNQFYQGVFQNILNSLNKNLTIEKDLIGRVRNNKFQLPWIEFWPLWSQEDDRNKIQQIIDLVSRQLTKAIFQQWNTIFPNENSNGKEIYIDFDCMEGKDTDEDDEIISTTMHTLRIKFEIKDGTERYKINDRSLGFRWFFMFMLFTQFRSYETSSNPILFLFDEPASNLHAAAQKKLVDAFPKVVTDKNKMIYTTHSHYMIDPHWLEHTYVVTNRNDDLPNSLLDEISLDDGTLDIKVEKYRSFANNHPTKTSYFQPILDRLEIVPSRFDIQKNNVILEGKSDYYILSYAMNLHTSENFDLCLIPAMGATTFNTLISLTVGWGMKSLYLLDADKAGKDAAKSYKENYILNDSQVILLNQLVSDIEQIEDLLDEEAKCFIQKYLGLNVTPSKSDILRFFSEALSKKDFQSLSKDFERKSKSILKQLADRFK